MTRYSLLASFILLALLVGPLYSQSSAVWKDPSPHASRFVRIDKEVRLELLDWGGSGRPIVLLAGGGNTAHIFDDFAAEAHDSLPCLWHHAARVRRLRLFSHQ